MSDVLFDAEGWKLVRESAALPDGRKKTIVRAHVCDTAHILAFPEPGKILLLREYRPFFQGYIWMLPSGKVDKEKDVLQAAQRELQEETGFRAATMKPYMQIQHTERFAYTCHVFIAEGLTSDPLPQDAHEMIEVHTLTIDDAIERIFQSNPVHSLSAMALQRYAHETS